MKKLLCVLMFGMVFGQAELTTRVYEYYISMLENETQDFSLSEITNGELDNNQDAMLQIFKTTDIVVDNSNYSYLIIQHERNPSTFVTFQTNIDLILYHTTPHGHKIYIGGEEHQWFAESGNITVTLYIAVTAEFPIEDTGYIEEGFDYCIDVGANLVASPCRDAVPILDTLPSEIADNLTGIIGQGVAATNQDGNWVGSLSGLGGGNGYWFTSNVNACFNYNCAEN